MQEYIVENFKYAFYSLSQGDCEIFLNGNTLKKHYYYNYNIQMSASNFLQIVRRQRTLCFTVKYYYFLILQNL